jgi:L-ascorbate metabolism protein UlaG (beta-lactamase superfamily)
MKRRQLIRYAQFGLLASLGTGLSLGFEAAQAQTKPKPKPTSAKPTTPTGGLTVQWLGHTCFLILGSGQRILVNPFKPGGCTAKYRQPKTDPTLVLISSQLLDEGYLDAVSNNPRLLYEPGVYKWGGLQFQGIRTEHDRMGGRRFGTNVAWRWNQGNLAIAHLGGIAAPLSLEQRILLGRPDVLFIPVGGGDKAYNAEEAKQAITTLNPRLVIPTHYRTQAADATCDLTGLDAFLKLMEGTPVRQVGSDTLSLQAKDLPQEGTAIAVLNYKF